MESGVKRTQRDYTLAFKLSVVEQVEKGELSYKQAQQRYGIQGRSTVLAEPARILRPLHHRNPAAYHKKASIVLW